MKNINGLKDQFFTELEGSYTENELNDIFNLIVKKSSGIATAPVNHQEVDFHEEVDFHDFQPKFDEALSRLKKYEPVEYILGEAEFYGRTFKVNSNVHVPRAETLTMVEWVKEDFQELQQRKVSALSLIDIGTGCGLLPITLGKELPIETTAVDLSKKALEVAKENAELNKIEVEFIQANVLKWEKLPKQYDIIVSNPPYVLEKARKDVQRKILKYEPEVALYVKDEDPMIFNRKIAQLAKESLSPGGFVYVEINQYLGAETAEVFAENGFRTELRKDIFGNDRTVKAYRKQ